MTAHPTRLRLAIVEDDTSLREDLAEIVATSSEWEVAGVYSDAESALPALVANPPDVVLMDIQLPGMSGIECVARLKTVAPQTTVLMVTVYDNNDRVFKALAAGASGYLLKCDAADKLLESLAEVVAGGSPMSGVIARKVVQHFQKSPPAPVQEHNLTARERELLDLLCKGLLNKEIAHELRISMDTVNSHLRNIYAKLHVRSRTEAVVKYLIPPGPPD